LYERYHFYWPAR